jgi:GAF domain-containing protein
MTVEFSSAGPHSGVTEQRLLQSVVAVARHVYSAAATSVFMVSPDTGELVFAAVAGAGQQSLVGRRFAPGTGIAGWVAASCQTLITDVSGTDRFARDAAASTGYLPASIMAAPLVAEGECIGVLEVLDRRVSAPDDAARELDDMELLDLIAAQAALSLALLRRTDRTAPPPPLGNLLARLSEHAAMDASDPLAVALLGVSLDLLDRRTRTVAHR